MKRDVALETLAQDGLLTKNDVSTLLSVFEEDPEVTWDGAFEQAGLPRDHPARSLITEDGELKTVTSEAHGRYRLVEPLGEGAMGRVSLVQDQHLNRKVARKELLVEAPALQARFLREARITGQLEHPGIIPIYEVGETEEGALYYTMKRIRGRTLEEVLAEKQTLDERLELLSVFVSLCQAVGYAHSRGVVHRDLKPANVMIGAFGETLVLDWGLARVLDEPEEAADPAESVLANDSPGLTRVGTVMGTPLYMSPEQANGHPADARSDVFSLGAILFEIIAGVSPYRVADAPVLEQAREGRPPPCPGGSGVRPLCSVVERALRHRPSERFADAAEMALEVERFRTGDLVRSHRYGGTEALVRFARAHQTAAAAAFTLLLGVVGVAAVAVPWSLAARDRAEAAAVLANQQKERAVEALLRAGAEAAANANHTNKEWAFKAALGEPPTLDLSRIPTKTIPLPADFRFREMALSDSGDLLFVVSEPVERRATLLAISTQSGRILHARDLEARAPSLEMVGDLLWFQGSSRETPVILGRDLGEVARADLRFWELKAIDDQRVLGTGKEGTAILTARGSVLSSIPELKFSTIEIDPDAPRAALGTWGLRDRSGEVVVVSTDTELQVLNQMDAETSVALFAFDGDHLAVGRTQTSVMDGNENIPVGRNGVEIWDMAKTARLESRTLPSYTSPEGLFYFSDALLVSMRYQTMEIGGRDRDWPYAFAMRAHQHWIARDETSILILPGLEDPASARIALRSPIARSVLAPESSTVVSANGALLAIASSDDTIEISPVANTFLQELGGPERPLGFDWRYLGSRRGFQGLNGFVRDGKGFKRTNAFVDSTTGAVRYGPDATGQVVALGTETSRGLQLDEAGRLVHLNEHGQAPWPPLETLPIEDSQGGAYARVAWADNERCLSLARGRSLLLYSMVNDAVVWQRTVESAAMLEAATQIVLDDCERVALTDAPSKEATLYGPNGTSLRLPAAGKLLGTAGMLVGEKRGASWWLDTEADPNPQWFAPEARPVAAGRSDTGDPLVALVIAERLVVRDLSTGEDVLDVPKPYEEHPRIEFVSAHHLVVKHRSGGIELFELGRGQSVLRVPGLNMKAAVVLDETLLGVVRTSEGPAHLRIPLEHSGTNWRVCEDTLTAQPVIPFPPADAQWAPSCALPDAQPTSTATPPTD